MSSFDSDDDSDIEGQNPVQKSLLGNKAQKKIAVGVGEIDAVTTR